MGSSDQERADRTAGNGHPHEVPPPDDLAETAIALDDLSLRGQAEREGPLFWATIARELQWETTPAEAIAGEGPSARWFRDGMGNLTTNCLDRHLHESRRDKPALIWHGARGEMRRYSYAELHRLVCKLASGLKELGVGAGTNVALSLPPSPECVAALLACARLGAIAAPITASMEAGIHAQMRAMRVRLMISASAPIDDPTKPSRLTVWHRASADETTAATAIDLADLLKGASPRCEPLIVAGDTSFLAFAADAATGNAAGAQFTHGGFAVGVSFATRIAYDLKDETIYCPVGPADWLAARPALFLGPLLNGTTIVLHETPPAPATLWETLAGDRVTTVVAPTTLLRDLAADNERAAAPTDHTIRLVIADGSPLPVETWWTLYRTILHERAHLCANWWEPSFGAPVIGTLPSMAARPGWLGKPFPGIAATLDGGEGNDDAGEGPLRLDGSWPHLAQGVDLSKIAPPARRDEADYLTIVANN